MRTATRIIFLLVILLGMSAALSCFTAGEEDDDSDDSDGDTGEPTQCKAGMAIIYDCWLALFDANYNELSEAEATAACEAGDTVAVCAAVCALATSTCYSIETCFADNCGPGGGTGPDDDGSSDCEVGMAILYDCDYALWRRRGRLRGRLRPGRLHL